MSDGRAGGASAVTPASRQIQIGLYLTNQHPVGADMVEALRGQIRLLHHARDHGWDSVWGAQHFLPTMAMTQPGPFLARLAAEAGELRVGLGILLLALANPLEVAETYASMDVVCSGRFTLGVGLGYRDVEYDAFGVPRRERVRRFKENLRLVEALWAGEAVSVDLPWCRLNNATLTMLPAQRPRPPLWMAADSDRAVERAARMADSWIINPHATTSTIARQLQLFHKVRRELGRPPLPELPPSRRWCAPARASAPWRSRSPTSRQSTRHTEPGDRTRRSRPTRRSTCPSNVCAKTGS
jgi:alkanesulfonate monooxygenase SsuD/methylene tetrahydromethanopterin reductase-like flavin-dependent oxidoreductase (luciferase family)